MLTDWEIHEIKHEYVNSPIGRDVCRLVDEIRRLRNENRVLESCAIKFNSGVLDAEQWIRRC